MSIGDVSPSMKITFALGPLSTSDNGFVFISVELLFPWNGLTDSDVNWKAPNNT